MENKQEELESLKIMKEKCRKNRGIILEKARSLRQGRTDSEMRTEEKLIEMEYRKDYNSMTMTICMLEDDMKELQRQIAFEDNFTKLKKARLYAESPFDRDMKTQGDL